MKAQKTIQKRVMRKVLEGRLNQARQIAQTYPHEGTVICEKCSNIIETSSSYNQRKWLAKLLGALGEDNDPLVSERSFWEPEKAQPKTEIQK